LSLPFFHLDRIERHLLDLGKLRYRDPVKVDGFVATPDTEKAVNPKPFEPGPESREIRIGEFWSGRDAYLWLRRDVEFPAEWVGEDVVGFFDFGITGIGNNSAFESLLYVGGAPYQGVDSNHREVFFDLKKVGTAVRLDFRLWSGLEGGGVPTPQYHQIKDAFIARLDGPTDDLYFTAKNAVDTVRILDDSNYAKHALEKLLVETFALIDFTNPRSAEFYESCARAAAYLNGGIDGMGKASDVKVHCVGHTHIDMAWLWRLKHTREKAARSFSTVDRLMDRFGEYEFLQTQAQLYEYVKGDFPEIYERIKERVREGKWEPSGSMWVEADCNLTSGESLVRQILFAKRFFAKEFGFENSFLWLPDVFGYSWALPQILKKSGIDTFLTTKISWSEVNRMPYDTFMWRGIDGTEVLTHFITTPDVCGDTKFYTYNGNILPKIVDGVWKTYRNKDLNQDMLISYGYGDGGGGVNRDMLENRRRTDRIPGLPSVKPTKVTDYLKKLHATLADGTNTGYRHVWDNELYLEFHRGTYTSQAKNKLMNRKLELRLRDGEILQTLAAAATGAWDAYPAGFLEEAWKIVLRNQFHDIIPGSSIREVYEDSAIEYAEASQIADGVVDSALATVAPASEGDFAVFNTSAWKRSTYARLPALDLSKGHLETADGTKIPAQEIDGACLAFFADLAPVSAAAARYVPGAAPVASAFTVGPNSAESPLVALEWNDKGQLVRFFDKALGRNVLAGPANLLQIFEDKPRQYDAWELESTIDLKAEVIDRFEGAETVSDGPCALRIRFAWTYNKTRIEQYLTLYAAHSRVDFDTRVDWQERDKILKVAFPVDVRATTARYDIQYGSAERPTHRSTSWDFAKFEVVGHQWADLSERGLGVALMNDCKYGYDVKDNVMRLSLLKSATFPDPEADLGEQRFTYALYAHGEAWNESGLIPLAWDLNAPLVAAAGKPLAPAGMPAAPFRIDNPHVALDAFKRAEDGSGVILRLHETGGGKTSLAVDLGFPVKGWREADLMESPVGDLVAGGEIRRELKPFEIFTVLIEPK